MLGLASDSADRPQSGGRENFFASFIRYDVSKEQEEELKTAHDRMVGYPKIFKTLGGEELFLSSLYKACAIEFVGMALFTYAHIGIVLSSMTFPYPPLVSAIFHGVMLFLFITIFSASSGAHFNSLITYGTVLTGHTRFFRGVLYILSQITGSFIAGLCMKASIPFEIAGPIRLGSCYVGDLGPGASITMEFFFSELLLAVSYGVAFNARQGEIYGPVLAPIFIGFMLALTIFASSAIAPPPYTGTGSNPSLCFGCLAAFATYNESQYLDRPVFYRHWVYWLGPGIAGTFNAVLYYIAPPHHQNLYHEEERQKKEKKNS